jgi:hypothetical protein
MCRIRGERIGDRGWSALQRAVEEEKRSSLRQLAAGLSCIDRERQGDVSDLNE